MSNKPSIVSKIWSFAIVLRDDGVNYDDYIELSRMTKKKDKVLLRNIRERAATKIQQSV